MLGRKYVSISLNAKGLTRASPILANIKLHINKIIMAMNIFNRLFVNDKMIISSRLYSPNHNKDIILKNPLTEIKECYCFLVSQPKKNLSKAMSVMYIQFLVNSKMIYGEYL
jgi:hypothetical protein